MDESGPGGREVVNVDAERLQFATMLSTFLNKTLTTKTPVDVLKNKLRAALDAADVIPEQQEALDERLKTLVVDPINALPENQRRVQGKVRTGEEIARAIPDVAAFLNEVDDMREGTFFELNEAGQLVMKDGCNEAYGLYEDFIEAKIRQTRVVYR